MSMNITHSVKSIVFVNELSLLYINVSINVNFHEFQGHL